MTANRLCILYPLLAPLACAAPVAVGYEAETSPAERDRLHRQLERPPSIDPVELTSTTITGTLPAPIDFVRDWFVPFPLDRAIPGTEEIPGVDRTELLTQAWGSPGDRRRVVLKDGGTALEEVVINEMPRRFRYVVWNYNADAARYIRFGVGEWQFTEQGDQTAVTWTYGFQPRGWPASWLLPSFVDGDYREFMESCLQAIIRGALEDFGEQQFGAFHGAQNTGEDDKVGLAPEK